jgi:hypothetical protein
MAAIKTASEALSNAMMKIGEAMKQANETPAQGADTASTTEAPKEGGEAGTEAK